MGFCYDQFNRLCCDFCGESGGVRRIRCPFGWCQAMATCPKCRVTQKVYLSKAAHRERGCEKYHLQFEADRAERAALIAAGECVLKSGYGHETVHAIFESKDGYLARYVPADVYRHWHERANATLSWFELLAGEVLPVAPVSFITKEV